MPDQLLLTTIETSTMTGWIDHQFYSIVESLVNDNCLVAMTELEVSNEILHQASIVNSIKLAVRINQS